MPVKKLQQCSRCLYDQTLPNITFDSQGHCTYCQIHDQMEAEYPLGPAGWKHLKKIAEEIKRAGRGRKYDCTIGVSGGCDSSYLLYIAKKKLGLRPLAVHFDNTWNSKIAVENIYCVLKPLKIDLFTFVVDNDEFNDLARSLLLASVPEIDAITDIGLVSALYMASEKYKIKYSLTADSFRTEGISPLGWFYFDGKYVAEIHKKFGKLPMSQFPNLWLWRQIKWMLLGIKRIRPLYYMEYDKEKVKKFLTKEFGWRWYGGHHQENRYTLFNHFYALEKFKIDFRYVEASAMIRSGQLTRKQAEEFVQRPFTIEQSILDEIKKRLKLTDEEFIRIMSAPPKNAQEYASYHQTFKRLKWFFYLMYKLDRVPKSFFVKYCQ